MKQVIQNYKTGELKLLEVPSPYCKSNSVIIQNMVSLISIGTEKQMIELGQKSLLGKAKARPDLVKRFIAKAKKEGLIKTFNEALGRMDNPVPLGYSSSGIVIEVGRDVHKFTPGDRVACIGAGFASHAEFVAIPENLCVKLPENAVTKEPVSFEEGSFGMLGIVALHGIRCANLKFGENVAVVGLGLLGLISVQILKAYGCQVIATDISNSKLDMAKKLGADVVCVLPEFVNKCNILSEGAGVDAVILTVATKTEEPVNLAVEASRFKGKIVLVGVADIHPNRNEMWHKEVEIIVSCAGGPGTFDPFYEIQGIDYPFGYVRWTENRNLQEFLRLIADKKISMSSLITHRFSINEAEKVYENLMSNTGGPYVGVTLNYPESNSKKNTIILKNTQQKTEKQISLGVIGAGLFGKALMLPALKKNKAFNLHTISTATGPNGQNVGLKYGFSACTTNYKEVIANPNINALMILTSHSAHCSMVLKALDSGKHIFVEKPLCINENELSRIITAYEALNIKPAFTVGYNRRFSPLALKLKNFFINRQDPLIMTYRVNPGFVPADSWVHQPEEGGSRIIGEMCHFVDMMQYVSGSLVSKVFAERISANNKTALNSDNISITFKFNDGSIGNLIYTASGDKSFSRERMEAFCEGKTIVLDDYRILTTFNNGKQNKISLWNQDMGYDSEISNFAETILGKTKPILTPEEFFNSTLTVIKANESVDKGGPVLI
ncbi:MAG: hypothetical protein A2252_08330 [Elusimicrobia bacterium RIFOXYA2_FULL_39_19]|nr:MAG: hypothetical protein A2252_08330 [Elusimicrobia bacterium RIFOXYA2_FULL_39_19]